MNMPDSTAVSTPDALVLTIWHTYESGTILGGTCKGDTASEALGSPKRGGLGWRWSRNIVTPDGEDGAWYIRYSRNKPAKQGEITRAVGRLEGLGYRVEIRRDNIPRDRRESEADRAQHMEERADALAGEATAVDLDETYVSTGGDGNDHQAV